VQPTRSFAFGDVIWIILTGGVYLLFYPFKSKKCPMCKGKNFVSVQEASAAGYLK